MGLIFEITLSQNIRFKRSEFSDFKEPYFKLSSTFDFFRMSQKHQISLEKNYFFKDFFRT